MNVNCIICSDLFTPSADIYITQCGHMFHYVCLTQWIERSKTCPQCRHRTNEKTIHRVFMNFSSTEGIVDDAATLQCKVDNLQFQLTLRDKDIKIYTDKYKNVKSQNNGLREEIKELENKRKLCDSAMHALKEQINYFKSKAKEGDRLHEEIMKLKNKVRDFERIKLVMDGSREQVNDMLRNNNDAQSLALLVATLKKGCGKMNVNCIICSDLFTPSADIYITQCGHMFHYVCLTQWIERSKTCPQCRHRTNEKTIHRVFMNFSSTEGIVDDAATLQCKVDNLQFQLTLRDKDIKIYTDKYKNVKSQNNGLREEIKELENKRKLCDSAMHALKEQINYFKSKAKEGDRLHEEIMKLKNKVRDFERIKLVMDGSREQVNDMLRNNNDAQSLALLVATLKKALIDADRKKRELEHSVKQAQNDATKYRKEVEKILKENAVLLDVNEAHKNCEAERQNLKRKIIELENRMTHTPDVSLRRIINESPAPLPRCKSNNDDVAITKYVSPTVSERVKIIKDSQSPYLNIKSSNVGVGFSDLLVKTRTSAPTLNQGKNKFSIFKQPAQPPQTATARPDYAYDGLGGHSKEDLFPSPVKKSSGIKRHKSASSGISSTKYRKLAPTKKLDDFFAQLNDSSS